MIVTNHNPLSQNNRKVICIGVFCSEANDFFVLPSCLIRIRSPPSIFEFLKNLNIGGFLMKENNKLNKNYIEKNMKTKIMMKEMNMISTLNIFYILL